MKKSLLLFSSLFFLSTATKLIGSSEMDDSDNTTSKTSLSYVMKVSNYSDNAYTSHVNEKFEQASIDARNKNNKLYQLHKKSTPAPTATKNLVVGSKAWSDSKK